MFVEIIDFFSFHGFFISLLLNGYAVYVPSLLKTECDFLFSPHFVGFFCGYVS